MNLRFSFIITCGVALTRNAAAQADVSGGTATAKPKPPVEFRVLETRSVEIQGRTTVLNRVASPVLPQEPAAPTPPTAQNTADAEAADGLIQEKKHQVLFFSATVYDRKVAEVRWFEAGRQVRIFSNIDFNLLAGAGEIETADAVYLLMLGIQNETSESGEDYQATEEELAAVKAWIAAPDIILSEEQLQRIYEFPAGSVWDFFLAELGVKKIPTTRERIEAGFESYLTLYNFTPEQTTALRKIKEAFVANLTSHGKVDLDAIFANPIYARLIGSFEEINAKFDGRLREIVGGMQDGFRSVA